MTMRTSSGALIAGVVLSVLSGACGGGIAYEAAPCPNCGDIRYPGDGPIAEEAAMSSKPTVDDAEAFMAQLEVCMYENILIQTRREMLKQWSIT